MSTRKMKKNVTEAVDRTTNQPSKEDKLTNELFAKVGVEIGDPKSKSKTSFYITRLTQTFLKLTSDVYGLPQGDIINYATPVFAKIAQTSLNRREKSLATLKTLDKQIQSSIEAMKAVAPHLSDLLRDPADMISGLIDLEEQAVKAKVIEGLGIKHETVQNDVPFPLYMIFCGDEPYESEPAYAKELREFFEGNEFDILLQIAEDMKKKEAADETDEPRTN
jgi:hypothetical protein